MPISFAMVSVTVHAPAGALASISTSGDSLLELALPALVSGACHDGVAEVEAWMAIPALRRSGKTAHLRRIHRSGTRSAQHLAKPAHDLYFSPQHEEFQPRTLWSLSNAFTSAFKQLEPIPPFRATAKLAGFLEAS